MRFGARFKSGFASVINYRAVKHPLRPNFRQPCPFLTNNKHCIWSKACKSCLRRSFHRFESNCLCMPHFTGDDRASERAPFYAWLSPFCRAMGKPASVQLISCSKFASCRVQVLGCQNFLALQVLKFASTHCTTRLFGLAALKRCISAHTRHGWLVHHVHAADSHSSGCL
jgi:hypothetical protein